MEYVFLGELGAQEQCWAPRRAGALKIEIERSSYDAAGRSFKAETVYRVSEKRIGAVSLWNEEMQSVSVA
jgi:hypothetical protein